jgi:hypothetical protein
VVVEIRIKGGSKREGWHGSTVTIILQLWSSLVHLLYVVFVVALHNIVIKQMVVEV